MSNFFKHFAQIMEGRRSPADFVPEGTSAHRIASQMGGDNRLNADILTPGGGRKIPGDIRHNLYGGDDPRLHAENKSGEAGNHDIPGAFQTLRHHPGDIVRSILAAYGIESGISSLSSGLSGSSMSATDAATADTAEFEPLAGSPYSGITAEDAAASAAAAGAAGAGGSADVLGGAEAGAGAGGTQFLSADPVLANLAPDIGASLGLDFTSFTPETAGLDLGGQGVLAGGDAAGAGLTDYSSLADAWGNNPTGLGEGVNGPGGANSANTAAKAVKPWYVQHAPSLLNFGMGILGQTQKQQLPESAKAARDAANATLPGAQATVQSGGTASPNWNTQKGAIDASIDQQLKEQTAALTQQAANSGMGADSQVTQQQVGTMKSKLEAQRQMLYLQAQQQNVQQALAVLTEDNSVLQSIAEFELKSDKAASQSLLHSAGMAAYLYSMGV